MALKITRVDPKVMLVKPSEMKVGYTLLAFGEPAIVTFISHMNKVVRVFSFKEGDLREIPWNDHYNLIDCELTYKTRKVGE